MKGLLFFPLVDNEERERQRRIPRMYRLLLICHYLALPLVIVICLGAMPVYLPIEPVSRKNVPFKNEHCHDAKCKGESRRMCEWLIVMSTFLAIYILHLLLVSLLRLSLVCLVVALSRS